MTQTWKASTKYVSACAAAAILVAATTAAVVLAETITITYTGQGFIVDEGTAILRDERCGLEGQGSANDGGTGQFATWNNGQPYQTGDPYLVWVLSLNATPVGGVTLHLPDGDVQMIQVGGTWKYASQYYSYADLVNFPVTVTFEGNGIRANVRSNARLVVSHGCSPGPEGDGAWCSPGFWKNARDGAWDRTGASKSDLFNFTVVPSFYDTAYLNDPDYPDGPTLVQVLDTPGANTFGGASGPLGLNAYNATGAYLTNLLPGYSFSLEVMEEGGELACPLDSHGNWKKGTIWNP